MRHKTKPTQWLQLIFKLKSRLDIHTNTYATNIMAYSGFSPFITMDLKRLEKPKSLGCECIEDRNMMQGGEYLYH